MPAALPLRAAAGIPHGRSYVEHLLADPESGTPPDGGRGRSVSRSVEKEIARHGSLRITKETGLFEARP